MTITARPINTVLWGDIFVVATAFEEIYDVIFRWRFVGEDGETYRGKGMVILDIFDHPTGYNHALVGSKSALYEAGRGIPMDQVMYELLLRSEHLLKHINNFEEPKKR